jgi:hypothetical protein
MGARALFVLIFMAAQAVAQQPALHTVNVTFSATGKYTVGEEAIQRTSTVMGNSRTWVR